MTDVDVSERVRTVLAGADEPLSAGAIQRRVAREGLDIATGAIREACEELREEGAIEAVDDPPRRTYRVVE